MARVVAPLNANHVTDDRPTSTVSNGTIVSARTPIGPTTATAAVRIRVYVPDVDYREVLSFNTEESVCLAKQKILDALPKNSLKDGLNYGLYLPESNGRSGKFLDEARPLRDYPLSGPIALLEFKFKRREYKPTLTPVKLKKLQSPANLKHLLDCVSKNDVEGITKWTDKGLDPNFNTCGDGETPLTLAAVKPRPHSVMMTLVSGGAFLDFRNRRSLTAMHVAADCGNRDAIRTLLDLGASPNCEDAKGLTPLYHCVLNATSSSQCVQMLLHDHAKIEHRDTAGWTEVHQACKNGLSQHLEHLLFFGADINAKTSSGDTPLHICARFDKEDCARVLMFRGAEKELKNGTGHNAYQVAVAASYHNLADTIQKFKPEQVVLYSELPKYNDKRRGTISAGTLRNLRKSRINSLWFDSGLTDNANCVSLFNSTGHVHSDAATHVRSSVMTTFMVQETRTVRIRRNESGFGFVLRGSKGRDDGTGMLNFKPTPEMPSLQYFESVTAGSPAEQAGLRPGDYLLAINSDNVASSTHDRCVQLIVKGGHTLVLKVTKPAGHVDTLPRASTLIAEDVDAKLNGFDKTSEHSSQTVETAEIHTPPPSLPNGPVDTVNSEHTYDDNRDVIMHGDQRLDDGVVSVNDAEPEPEPDHNDDSVFPSPPASVVNVGLAVSAAAEQCDDASDSVTPADSVVEPVPTSRPASPPASADDTLPAPPTSFDVCSPSFPPPPPPPLPAFFNAAIRRDSTVTSAPKLSSGLPQQSGKAGAGPSQSELQEKRRQDANNAALMAAVERRRSLLESTDAEEIAKSIENQVRRSSKMQMVFRAGTGTTERRTSTAAPRGLLAAATKPDTPKVVENGSSSVDFMADAKRIQQDYLNKPTPSSEESKAAPAAAELSISVSTASSNTKPRAATAVSNGPSTVLVSVPASTHAVLTTVKTPPLSTSASRASSNTKPRAATAVFNGPSTVLVSLPANTNAIPTTVKPSAPSTSVSHSSSNTKPCAATAVSSGRSTVLVSLPANTRTIPTTVKTPLSSTSPSHASSKNPRTATAVSNGPSTVLVNVPANNNAISTTVKTPPPFTAGFGPSAASAVLVLPPPSPFAGDSVSAEVAPATSTLRRVTMQQSNSVVFRARNTKDATPAGASPAKTASGGRRIEEWTAEDIAKYLDSIDLGDYKPLFVNHGITGPALVAMREHDFAALGITTPLHRVKLEREIRKIAK